MSITLDGDNLTSTGVPNTRTAQTASGTSIDFTSIPSGTKRITVMFSNISTNGSSAYPMVQLGTGGSVTTTGYTSASGIFNNANATTVLTSTAGFPIRQAGSSSATTFGTMTLCLAGSNLWVSSHSFADVVDTVCGSGGGSVTLSGALDRVRFTTTNGTDTFDAGTINILYE
jgi:hypothetical protein